jgi:hypothetical protein
MSITMGNILLMRRLSSWLRVKRGWCVMMLWLWYHTVRGGGAPAHAQPSSRDAPTPAATRPPNDHTPATTGHTPQFLTRIPLSDVKRMTKTLFANERFAKNFCFHIIISFPSSYPYPTKWGQYNMFSSCCDHVSAIIFTTGRLPDVNPP